MKKIFLSFALVFAALEAFGVVITPRQALERARDSRNKVAAREMTSLQLIHTALTAAGSPSVYVFENPGGAGYLLLSADDAAYPVLGYSDAGSFDADAMPPAMKWWVEQYGRQMEYAASHSPKAAGAGSALLARSRAGREAIAPMCRTHWDQVSPFNDQCPLQGAERTYTGCVATAMAQVMKYWEYPRRGTGSISYTAEDLQKKLSMNFDSRDFDWDKMADDYLPGQYTDEQAEAVAYLMKACGYSVRMNYSLDASGALSMYIRRGLTRYFNYDENAVYTLRDFHSAAEWEQLIYDNLRNVGPLIYGGSSTVGGGHSFVCDGYDGEGLFHFNWGWTGMSDGYFALSALNPEALGSGGGSGGGYNFDQDALLGIQPPTGQPVIPQPDRVTQMGSLTASLGEDNTLSLGLDVIADPMWVNYNATAMEVWIGARIASAADTVCVAVSSQAVKLQPGYGISPRYVNASVDLGTLALADGSYTVSIVSLDGDPETAAASDWLDPNTFYGYTTTASLTKSGDSYSLSCAPAPQLRIKDAGFSTDLYFGCMQKVYIEVENDSDIELSSGFAPVLVADGQMVMMGESVSTTVPAKSTLRREWVTDMYTLSEYFTVAADTPCYLTFLDEKTNMVLANECYEPVTLHPTPKNPTITLTATPTVEDAVMTDYQEASYVAKVANISDPYNIRISMPLEMTAGYCAYPVAAVVCEFADDSHSYVNIVTYGASPLFLDCLKSNALKPVVETATVDVNVSYPLLEEGKLYPLIFAYMTQQGFVNIAGGQPVYLCLDKNLGVESVDAGVKDVAISYDRATATAVAVSASGVADIAACDLSGRVVARSATGVLDLSEAPAGVMIISARDSDGNSAVVKVVK